ncbi:MAG: hypothetical protein M5U23_12830 [Acidimicrobiia bacterium]|nr:hypothetical protein [Acidimicrobiia bacterium]
MTNTEQRIRNALHAEADAWPPPPPAGIVPHRRPSVPGWMLASAAAAVVLVVGSMSIAFVGNQTTGPQGDGSQGTSGVTSASVAPATPSPVTEFSGPGVSTNTTGDETPTTDATAVELDWENDWEKIAMEHGAEPVSDAKIARAAGDPVPGMVPGSGFGFATSTQTDPPVDELGIVLYLATDSTESDQLYACVTDYAIIDGKTAVGSGRCESKPWDLLSFGFSASGGCLPSAETAPMLITVWGLPSTATEVAFEVGHDRGHIVSVPASGTAQVVVTGQSPIWSVNFEGINSEHRAELDQFLPAFENIAERCGADSGPG